MKCDVHFFTFHYFFPHGEKAPSGRKPSRCHGLTIILKYTTLGRTPLDEWSARHRDPYLATHSTHKWQISLSPVGFETAVPAKEQSPLQ